MSYVLRQAAIKSLLVLGVALIGLGSSGCAKTRTRVGEPTAHVRGAGAAPVTDESASRLRPDEDVDSSNDARAEQPARAGAGADSDVDSAGGSYYDWDDRSVLYYGHAAAEGDAQAIVAVIRAYYASAARGDGASACRLLSPRTARGLVAAYARTPGLGVFRGRTCAAVLTYLARELHDELSAEEATLKIGVIRVEGTAAHVMLGFEAAAPNRYTKLERAHGAWGLVDAFAGGLP